jgi:hypothetical protein
MWRDERTHVRRNVREVSRGINDEEDAALADPRRISLRYAIVKISIVTV